MSGNVIVTERAARKIGEILQKEPDGTMLRVSVEGGGCSGFQYKFDTERAKADDDIVIEKSGATVLIDPVSLNYMAGSEIDFVDDLIGAWTRSRSVEELLELLEANGVPCGRIYRAPEMLADPQYAAREAIVSVEHAVFGNIRMQNVAPKLSETPGQVRWPGPALGEHTEAVLSERLGLSTARLAELRAGGAI